MTFFLSSLLFLSSPVILSQYRDEMPVVSVIDNEYKCRQTYVVNKNLKKNDGLHNITSEMMQTYIDQWYNKLNKVDSYRLQFYNGKDRTRANNLLKTLSNHFPSIMFELKYEHSNFIVLSQKYFSFIEALVIYKSIGYINVIIIHNEELF